MGTGELFTRWTVRAALALYAAALVLRLSERRAVARWLWTAGCAIFIVHVLCAFEFYHHWSHAEAYAETARRTKEMVGWDWGGGVYFNYLFALVWTADSIWWWRGVDEYDRRSRGVEWLVQGYMAFIAFNATVVFGNGIIRWIGMATTLSLLLGAVVRRNWRKSSSPACRSRENN